MLPENVQKNAHAIVLGANYPLYFRYFFMKTSLKDFIIEINDDLTPMTNA